MCVCVCACVCMRVRACARVHTHGTEPLALCPEEPCPGCIHNDVLPVQLRQLQPRATGNEQDPSQPGSNAQASGLWGDQDKLECDDVFASSPTQPPPRQQSVTHCDTVCPYSAPLGTQRLLADPRAHTITQLHIPQSVCLADWQSVCLADWQSVRLTDWQSVRLTDRRAHRWLAFLRQTRA